MSPAARIRDFRRWMRTAIPIGVHIAAGALYALYLGATLIARIFKGHPSVDTFFLQTNLPLMGIILFGGYSFVYGMLRVFSNNVLLNKEYRGWLAASPWHWPKPLPFSRLQLHPYDAVPVFGCALLAYLHGIAWWWLFPYVFTVGYGFFWWWIFSCVDVGMVKHACPLSLLLTLFALNNPVLLAALLVAVHLFLWKGIVKILKHPGGMLQEDGYLDILNQITTPANAIVNTGWPMSMLAGKYEGNTFPDRLHGIVLAAEVAIAFAATAFWCSFDSLRAESHEEYAITRTVLWASAVICILFIMCLSYIKYFEHYASPISVWGRIATRQFYISGFDHVFHAPLGALAIVLAVPYLLSFWKVSSLVETPLALFLSLSFYFLTLPDLKRWRLTSRSRLRLLGQPSAKGNGMVKV